MQWCDFGKVVVTREAYKSAGGATGNGHGIAELSGLLYGVLEHRVCYAQSCHAKGLAESMAQRSLRSYIILCSIKSS